MTESQNNYQELEGQEGVSEVQPQVQVDTETAGEVKPNGQIELDMIADADLDANILHALRQVEPIYEMNHMKATARLVEFMRWHWIFIHLAFVTFFFFLLRHFMSVFDRHIAQGCQIAKDQKANAEYAYIPIFILFGLAVIVYPGVWLLFRSRIKQIFAQRTFYGASGKLGASDKQYIAKKDATLIVRYYKIGLFVFCFFQIALISVTVMVGLVDDDVDDLSYQCDCESSGPHDWTDPCFFISGYSSTSYYWWFTYFLWLLDLIVCTSLLRKFSGAGKAAWVEKINRQCKCCLP